MSHSKSKIVHYVWQNWGEKREKKIKGEKEEMEQKCKNFIFHDFNFIIKNQNLNFLFHSLSISSYLEGKLIVGMEGNKILPFPFSPLQFHPYKQRKNYLFPRFSHTPVPFHLPFFEPNISVKVRHKYQDSYSLVALSDSLRKTCIWISIPQLL